MMRTVAKIKSRDHYFSQGSKWYWSNSYGWQPYCYQRRTINFIRLVLKINVVYFVHLAGSISSYFSQNQSLVSWLSIILIKPFSFPVISLKSMIFFLNFIYCLSAVRLSDILYEKYLPSFFICGIVGYLDRTPPQKKYKKSVFFHCPG